MKTILTSVEWGKSITIAGPLLIDAAYVELEIVDQPPAPDGRRVVAFRPPMRPYLSVQPDGHLEANRDVIDVWERFEVWDNADGTVSYRSWRGFLSMDDLGVVRADRQTPGGWEKFRRPRTGLVGTLRITDGAFYDDTGPVLPIFCHAGDLLALFARDPSWAEGELDDIAAARYDGVRTWTWLEGSYWDRLERVYIPTSRFHGTYWETVRDFALALRRRGLRWIVSQGDMLRFAPDRAAFMRQLAETLRESGGFDVIAAIDAGNEAWQNGEDDPERLCAAVEPFRAVLPVPIWSLTSPQGEEQADLDRYSGSVYDVHGSRGGHVADKIRHAFGLAYEQRPRCRLGIQSEPPAAWSAGSLASVMDYPEEMDAEAVTLLTTMHLIARQASVWFSSPGVSCRQRGEFARQLGFASVPHVREVLPRDLMQFQTLCHGGESQRGTRVLCAAGEGDSLIRVDGAIADDGRFAVVVYGAVPGDWVVGLAVERRCELTTIHPVTREAFGPVQYWPGDTVGFRFRHGRIVTGRLR